jgi:hypothetical protein
MRNREMAENLARRASTAPALLFRYVPSNLTGVREVNLRGGPASLIEELGLAGRSDSGPPTIERLTLLWSGPDRVYVMSGVTATPATMVGLNLSAAVASMIDLANSVD